MVRAWSYRALVVQTWMIADILQNDHCVWALYHLRVLLCQFLMASLHIIGQMHHELFKESPIVGYLGCSILLAIINNAEMNIVQLNLYTFLRMNSEKSNCCCHYLWFVGSYLPQNSWDSPRSGGRDGVGKASATLCIYSSLTTAIS